MIPMVGAFAAALPTGVVQSAPASSAVAILLSLCLVVLVGALLYYYARLAPQRRELNATLEALTAPDARLRMLTDRLPILLWAVDRDLRITFADGAALAAVRERSADVVGRDLSEYLELASPSLPIDAHHRALLGESVTYQTRWRNRAFEVWLEPIRSGNGQVVGVQGVALDLAERRDFRKDLERQRALYEQILEHGEADIAVFDTQLRYEYVNARAVRDPAIREWMIGKDDDDYCRMRGKDPALARARQEWMRRAIAERRVMEFEESLHTPTGEARHFVRRFSPVLHRDGRVVRLIGYGFDITERKKAAEALRESAEQLRQAQKLEAVGRLAGGVAHDFNNLLMAILGNADLLLQEMDAGDPFREDVEEIAKAARRAAELTGQLLAFSRKQVLQARVLDVNERVREMERLLCRLIGEHIALETVLEDPLGLVKVDPSQLEQVLLNLAVNARDAMPHGGRLTIRTATVELDSSHPAIHDGLAPGAYVLLSVEDTGVGMDDETRGHIFEPFYTTKEQGKGTGLGLATVYGVVNQSGGHISLHSVPGEGTKFTIYFPIVQETEVPAATSPQPDAWEGSEVVLVVEDEEMVRKLVRRILVKNGYAVLEASCAEEALRISDEYERNIELLITDIVMPGMSGRELAERLSTKRPAMQILYMSGYTEDQIVHYRAGDGEAAFISKPFTPGEFGRRVRDLLDESRARGPGGEP